MVVDLKQKEWKNVSSTEVEAVSAAADQSEAPTSKITSLISDQSFLIRPTREYEGDRDRERERERERERGSCSSHKLVSREKKEEKSVEKEFGLSTLKVQKRSVIVSEQKRVRI